MVKLPISLLAVRELTRLDAPRIIVEMFVKTQARARIKIVRVALDQYFLILDAVVQAPEDMHVIGI